jgi:hypothetical protein
MLIQKLRFSGEFLKRGFWLYAWEIKHGERRVYYIGRTGDSSSQFASSPFSRLGQHLDLRPTATANMLLRHLRRLELDPVACAYELFAFGPIFPEQETLAKHREIRDKIAPLESALAEHMRSRGLEVLGIHGSKGIADPEMLAEIISEFQNSSLGNPI